MPHLDLYRDRMITKDTPYSFELQAYYKRKKRTYSFPVCGDIIRRIHNRTLSENLKRRLSQISEHQRQLTEVKSDLSFPNDRLLDYQKSGASWLIEIKKGILADDQGSGKTVISLAAALEINPNRAVVICSKTKRDEWVEEIKIWTGESAQIYEKKFEQVGSQPPVLWSDYLVVNYDAAMVNAVQISHADLVIIDEAHIMRNRKTKTFKKLRQICRKAEYVFLLTASPTVNVISDFWPLLCICDEKRFGSYWGFAFRFCEVILDVGMNVGNTKEEEKENLRRILDLYVLSRKGEEDLPEPEWVRIIYDLYTTQRKLYNEMDEMMETTYHFKKCVALTPLSKITRLRQLTLNPALIFNDYTGKSKLDLLPDLVYRWDGQTLIFAQYAELIRMAAELLNKMAIPSTYLTNKLTDKQKAKNLSMFKKGNYQVLAMTYKMGGEGLNLPQASQAIFLEYAWNPAGIRHAYKRVLRPGQTSDQIRFVIIHANGTIEDHILDILKEKRKVTVEEILKRKGE